MKLIKIIMILLVMSTLCKSQTILDPPSILDSLHQNMLNLQTTDFKLGWNWGNNRSVSQAIFANQNSIKLEFFCVNPVTKIFASDPEELQDNAYILVCDPRFWSGTLYDTTLMHSHSMTFEPTLYITENNPTQRQILAKRPNDPTHPIFGFTQIDDLARIPTDVADSDSSFLLIKNTNLINHKVFSDPWGSEFLFRTDYKVGDIVFNDPSQMKFQGYNYCVSVNLKRNGATDREKREINGVIASER